MVPRVTCFLLIGLSTALLTAQDGGGATTTRRVGSIPATPLLIMPAAGAAGRPQDEAPASRAKPTTPMEEVVALKAEYTAAQRAFSAEYQKAKTDEERSGLVKSKMPKASDWFTRMKAVADRVPGDDAAAEALLWLASSSGPRDQLHADAVKTLLANHRKSKAMSQLCGLLARDSSLEAEAALRDLARSSEHREVRAQATYSLASQRNQLASNAETLKAAGSESAKWVAESLGEDGVARVKALDPQALRAEGEALLDRVVAEFADCQTARKTTFGDMASAELFEIRNLAIGKTAPEISGENLNGEQMSLAAFRGKVVVLDFWGNW